MMGAGAGPGPGFAGPGMGGPGIGGFGTTPPTDQPKEEKPEDKMFSGFMDLAKDKLTDVKQHNEAAVDQYVTAYKDKRQSSGGDMMGSDMGGFNAPAEPSPFDNQPAE